MKTIKFKVAKGRVVRDSETNSLLDCDAIHVFDISPYWQRKLNSGDIELLDEISTVPLPDDEAESKNKAKMKKQGV